MKEECQRALERVYLFLDGELLSSEERVEIRAHLEACRPCFERYGLEEVVTGLVARLRHAHRCPEHVRVRITSLLQ
ncbi:MAG TPA: zf-HC2 domain-containing protein [Actinomycetota bacterium]|jgi:mycothiol system anti-sigma-R factor|nr:zf-HC2 domain-containing protein [Actinomycetota bacterium]